METHALFERYAPNLLSLEQKAEKGMLPDVVEPGHILELWMPGQGEGHRKQFFKQVITKAIASRSLPIHRLHEWEAGKPLPELSPRERLSVKEVAECLACRTGRYPGDEERRAASLRPVSVYRTSDPYQPHEIVSDFIPHQKAVDFLREHAGPPYPSDLEAAMEDPRLLSTDIGIHRDGFRVWLEQEGLWPLDRKIPLSGWWPEAETADKTPPPPSDDQDAEERALNEELGRHRRKQLEEFGKTRGQEASEDANERWSPFIDEAQALIKKGKSKSLAADIVAKRHKEQSINPDTLRRKL